MPPKLASRQLAYAPPPVPSFLQKLHSQVNNSRGNINDKRGPRRNNDDDDEPATSEFDDLLGVGSSSRTKQRDTTGKRGSQGGIEEEDEWDGAQVVVLKEGRHLSKEEAAGASKEQRAEGDAVPGKEAADGIVAVPQAAPASSSAAKRSQVASLDQTAESSGLDDVKKLIRSSKEGRDTESEDAMKKKRKEEKEKIKEERNKRAKVEKSKRGKGLSFSMDD